MFEKKEDKLFNYAFGELDVQDAQLFEAGFLDDKELMAEAEFLRSMKEDLVSFRDIPEMQYSKERLRSAILEQGLKPKRPANWINWVLAPSAVACVMALGFVLTNGISRPEPRFVQGQNTYADNWTPDIRLPKSSDTKADVKISNAPEGPKIAVNNDHSMPKLNIDHVVSVERKPKSLHRSSDRRNHDKAEVSNDSAKAMVVATTSDPTMALTGTTSKEIPTKDTATDMSPITDHNVLAMADSAPLNNDAMRVAFDSPSPKRGSDAQFIIIDKAQDSGVGAPVATEVNNTANVVIGG